MTSWRAAHAYTRQSSASARAPGSDRSSARMCPSPSWLSVFCPRTPADTERHEPNRRVGSPVVLGSFRCGSARVSACCRLRIRRSHVRIMLGALGGAQFSSRSFVPEATRKHPFIPGCTRFHRAGCERVVNGNPVRHRRPARGAAVTSRVYFGGTTRGAPVDRPNRAHRGIA